ncbi:MAG TPA: hypothetical protein VFW98_05715 [Gemmatimonadaceae bacterium]|nr:hypothetical protein [Gemmatimonadaceae bacterium]
MTDRLIPLDTLYARFDAFAEGRAQGKGCWAAHEAVLDRLAANQRVAEAHGWTSCALECAGGTGQLRAWGVPPTEYQRRLLPDWPFAPAAESLADP